MSTVSHTSEEEKAMKKTVWQGTQEEYERMLAERPALPPIPRREIEMPSAHAVDPPRFDSVRETIAVRMASHYQLYPEDQQDAEMQRMLNQIDEREGRDCGMVLSMAKRRLTRDRLAVVEEAIEAYQ